MRVRDEASRWLLAVVLLGAVPAAAQDYPPSLEAAALTAWLEESTNIEPASVVSVSPELVVAIVGKTMPTTPGGPVRLTLREEVISPAYVDAVGGRSSLMSMEIHCEERRLRMDERRLYAGASLSGAMEITEPSAEWFRIPDASIMDEVARAACDDGYAWPLRAPGASSAASSREIAAVEAPPMALPPGPDAKLVADEPEPSDDLGAVAAERLAPAAEASPPREAQAAPTEPAPVAQAAASLQPAAPEADLAPAPPEQPAVQTQGPTAPEPEPASAATPAGPTFAVQVGAYETAEMAQAAWAALSADRPVIVDGLTFEVRPARVKGKVWQRGLVGPFATRREAAAFCALIVGSQYGCILRTLAD